MILSPHEIAWLALHRWPDHDQARIAIAVALAESGGDTDAIGRSTEGDNVGQRDHGLWQISGRWHGDKLTGDPDWRDPVVNADLARQVWEDRKASGKKPWSAWAVFNSGAYEKYLPDADHGMAAPFPPPPRPVDAGEVADLLLNLVQPMAIDLAGIRRHFI